MAIPEKISKARQLAATGLLLSGLLAANLIAGKERQSQDGITIGYGGARRVEELLENKNKFIEATGVSSLRYSLPWKNIERNPGEFNFDNYFENLDEYGERLDPIFWTGYDPGWLRRQPNPEGLRPWQLRVDGSPDNQTYFVRFVRNFSQAFKDRYPAKQLVLEIGNELDCDNPANPDYSICFSGEDGVQAYAEVLRDVRTVVHEVDDTAIVANSGFALEPTNDFDFTFFRRLVETCPADSSTPCFDATSFHYYSDLRNYRTICNDPPDCQNKSYREFWNEQEDNGISSKINYVTRTLAGTGYPSDFPLYITEAGIGFKIPSPYADYSMTIPEKVYDFYQDQIVREVTRAGSFPQVERIYWYSIKDDARMYGQGGTWQCPEDSERCTSYGMHRVDFTAKGKVWETFKHLADRENGRRSEKIQGVAEPFEGYSFSDPDFLVAWSNSDEQISYQPPFFAYDVVSTDGRLSVDNQSGSLILNNRPVFIIKENAEVQIYSRIYMPFTSNRYNNR